MLAPLARFVTALALAGTTIQQDSRPAGAASQRTGTHFAIECAELDDAARDAVLATCEAAWRHTARLLGAGDRTPRDRIRVCVHADPKEYDEAARRLGGKRTASYGAFADRATQSAHVRLTPRIDRAISARIGLPISTRRLVAQEAARATLYAFAATADEPPPWLDDGLAAFAADQTLVTEKWCGPLESDPFGARALVLAKRWQASKSMRTLREIMTEARETEPSEYWPAIRHCAVRFLMSKQHEPRLRRVLAHLRAQAKTGTLTGRMAEELDKQFFGARQQQIESEFTAWLTSREPVWDELSPSLACDGSRWLQCAAPSPNADAYRARRVGQDEYAIRGTLEMLPSENAQMHLLLGREADGRHLQICFFRGGLTVLAWDPAGLAGKGRWVELARRETELLRDGVPLRFAAEVMGQTLRVTVEGAEVLRKPLAKWDPRGCWGVGVLEGTAGIWRDVTLGPLDTSK